MSRESQMLADCQPRALFQTFSSERGCNAQQMSVELQSHHVSRFMDVAYVSALAALGGSVVGGVTAGITNWLNQRAQVRAAQLAREMSRPVGFNAFWLRGTPHTLEILQSLGFIYHIDDVSRDEPFLVNVNNKPFAVVPYTLHMNDIVDYEGRYFSTSMYAGDVKAEFDALYAEAEYRRRMMSVSTHDRIAGRPSRTKTHEEFISYAQSHPGVVFMRKDEIARFALSSPLTVREGILRAESAETRG
jgi:hypothetical protein